MHLSLYHAKASSKGSCQRPQYATTGAGHIRYQEEGGWSLQPGAFRVPGNRPSDNSDIVSVEDSTVAPPPSVAEDSVIRVPEAQLVDPATDTEAAVARALQAAREQAQADTEAGMARALQAAREQTQTDTEAAIARALEEAREQTRHALREELLHQERNEERQPGVRPELLQEKKGPHATDEEGNSTFRMLAFIRKHAVVSCLLCFLLLFGAVGAGIGVAFSSSNKKASSGKGEETRPTAIPSQYPTATPVGISSWTRVGSTLRGVGTGGWFGGFNTLALSSDGTIVAVGAPAIDAGYTQVFQRVGGGTDEEQADEWQPMGVALNGVAEGDGFGRSVALSSNGQILAVGATGSGDVRVFAYDSINNQWNRRGSKIVGVAADDWFGRSVALSFDGNTLAVGAPRNDDNRSKNSGHARVYTFNSTSNEWEQQGSTLTGVGEYDSFGNSVDLSADGTILAVGGRGNVRAFQFNSNSTEWDPLGLAIHGVVEGDYFGWSVALSSNGLVLAAGALYNDDNGSDSGHVRVFKYNTISNRWVPQGSAIVGVGVSNQFGWSVALSADGNQVAAGAIGNSPIVTNSGHVRVFQYERSSGTTGQWKQVGAALTGMGGESDFFGRSVAMSADGRVVAGGADENNINILGPGYVCVYEKVAE